MSKPARPPPATSGRILLLLLNGNKYVKYKTKQSIPLTTPNELTLSIPLISCVKFDTKQHYTFALHEIWPFSKLQLEERDNGQQ